MVRRQTVAEGPSSPVIMVSGVYMAPFIMSASDALTGVIQLAHLGGQFTQKTDLLEGGKRQACGAGLLR